MLLFRENGPQMPWTLVYCRYSSVMTLMKTQHLRTHACTQLIFIEHVMYAKYFPGAALDSGSELINRLMYMSGDDKA